MRTHYENLQVIENASPEAIKGAYKHLSQKWHPDKHSENRIEAERILRILNEAYEVLSNTELRKQYDLRLKDRRNKNNTIDNSIHEKFKEWDNKNRKDREENFKNKGMTKPTSYDFGIKPKENTVIEKKKCSNRYYYILFAMVVFITSYFSEDHTGGALIGLFVGALIVVIAYAVSDVFKKEKQELSENKKSDSVWPYILLMPLVFKIYHSQIEPKITDWNSKSEQVSEVKQRVKINANKINSEEKNISDSEKSREPTDKSMQLSLVNIESVVSAPMPDIPKSDGSFGKGKGLHNGFSYYDEANEIIYGVIYQVGFDDSYKNDIENAIKNYITGMASTKNSKVSNLKYLGGDKTFASATFELEYSSSGVGIKGYYYLIYKNGHFYMWSVKEFKSISKISAQSIFLDNYQRFRVI